MPAAFTLADHDDRLVQAVSSTWDKQSLSTTPSFISQKCIPFLRHDFNVIHLQTNKKSAPVGFIFCTARLSVILESNNTCVDITHSDDFVNSCVIFLTRCGRVDCPPVWNIPPDILH